jgi:type II secretory pathway predicted ATPase ExeA/peptidoglycan hydrolase-like protein with peptidoglycan-binding domain
MYESFYGLREKPFSLIPDPDFLYLSRLHKAALNMLEYGLRGEAGFTLISGEVGSGKTILVRRFLKMVDKNTVVGLITNTHSSIGNLLEWILLAFGLDYRGKDKVELYQMFSEFLADLQVEQRRAILIIDEAQNMELDTLEELRMLSNINADKNLVLQIVLVGQPEILEKLNRPEMRQMTQRISVTFRLWPLTFAESCGYVRHRIMVAGGSPAIFDDSACGAIYHFTEGLPRPINVLCDAALVYGFGEGKAVIDIDTILDVIEDRQRSGLQPFSQHEKEFDRVELAETISELVETYGTPELLEEAASLPSDESSFIVDELGDDGAADSVAPFVDSGPDDFHGLDHDADHVRSFVDQTDQEFYDPDDAASYMEGPGYSDSEEKGRSGTYADPRDRRRRGGWGRWAAIVALVCVGLATAIWTLPYLSGSLNSSEFPVISDLVKRLSESSPTETAPEAVPIVEAVVDEEPMTGPEEAVETAAAAGEAEAAPDPIEDTPPATTEPISTEPISTEPISVEVIEYFAAPEEISTGESLEESEQEQQSQDPLEDSHGLRSASERRGEVSEADQVAVAVESQEIDTGESAEEAASGQETTGTSGSAVERASQDLLRLSGIDSSAVAVDESLAFSQLRGDLSSALSSLFASWAVDYLSAQGTSPCGKALREGLRCFEARGDWELIGRLNRPALISLNAPDGRQIHGMVSALDRGKAAFMIDGREHLVALDQLTPYWSGEFLLLWRPPTVYRRLLHQGLRGDDVVWLRNQLSAVNGVAPATQDAIVFDEALTDEVIAFQRARGLKVDGLVGSETLVHLSSVSAQAGEPVLSDRVL